MVVWFIMKSVSGSYGDTDFFVSEKNTKRVFN